MKRTATLCVLAAGLAIALAVTPLASVTLAGAAPMSPAQQATPSQAAPARAPSDQRIALAETLLFQTRHLQNVQAPAILVYTFHKEGKLEAGFDDQVKLILAANKTASLSFLSGARQRMAPQVDDAEGNPVLLAFLERDIAEMHRLTGGSSAYFRKRIRLALADGAQVRPQRFQYGGKALDGSEVSIEPYRRDPMHERFEQFTAKRYIFLMSAQVPGGVYQVHTVVPGTVSADERKPERPASSDGMADARIASRGSRASASLVDETMTLVGVEPGTR